jgi:hypothetical protein
MIGIFSNRVDKSRMMFEALYIGSPFFKNACETSHLVQSNIEYLVKRLWGTGADWENVTRNNYVFIKILTIQIENKKPHKL